jgi:hypothetical protein
LKRVDDLRNWLSLWAREVILVNYAKLGEILLGDLGSEEWEECVGAVWWVVTREMAEEKLREAGAKCTVVRITSAILDTPRCEVSSYGCVFEI